mmetsp:Transcript_17990/g.32017  ORF Transcript_17990/g.32017 Transcript_17990/m.32017 type:complete len:369 (-) Transcript_17990:85-1191(-)
MALARRAAASALHRLLRQPAAGRGTGGLQLLAPAGRRTVSKEADTSKIKQLLEEVAAGGIPPEGVAARQAAEAAAEEAALAAEGGIGAKIGNALTLFGLAGSTYFGYYTYKYSAEEMEKTLDELSGQEEVPLWTQGWVAVMEHYVRIRRKVEGWVKDYADPPTDKLLPDIPPNVIYPRLTVVLDLNETLVHSDWTRGRGWKVFKRPGVEDFIRTLAPQVELVMYTDQLSTYAEPILDRIDPNRMIRFRLYRDSTQYHNGRHVRDLSKLNRDLGQIIFITSNPEAYEFQPDNAVQIKPWKLDDGDTVLLDLLPFIELIVKTNVADVRDVMRSYEGQDIPSAFRKRMEELAQRRQQQVKQHRGLLGIQLR